MNLTTKKVSIAGLIIALGIVYGDIGTSPLYTMNAIVRGRVVDELLVVGAVSLVIWTLTVQTTIKYVWLTLKADNKGEGGIFSLYALVRKYSKKIMLIAMIGGAALLADGLITPAITITSAIEGIGMDESSTVTLVLFILVILFFLQQFGTRSIGKLFGPVMLIWFLLMAVMGLIHIADDVKIFKAINPYYGIKLLVVEPKGFWILGAVFLCTTGAEALYSDLGHCGKKNIHISWIFVKTCLILNYTGQGAWLLHNHLGEVLPTGVNPFFQIIPVNFRGTGILIAAFAAIIASQALITGAFSIISEAMKLNLWPKFKVSYPSREIGQLYISTINWALFAGCSMIVLSFRSSEAMEGAYGLSITITMIMTSILFSYYMYVKRYPKFWIGLYLVVYMTIELSFLTANLEKFGHGGKVTIFIGSVLFAVMFVWNRARKIRNRHVEFVPISSYVPILRKLSKDKSAPKYATHLVYLTSADNPKEIEHKIIYSILYKRPKRADIYWFVHVNVVDHPHTTEYSVETIVPNEIIRIEFRLGFKVEHRIQLMLRKVFEEMEEKKEVVIKSRYDSLVDEGIPGDFRFVVIEKFLSKENELPMFDRIVMKAYFLLKQISLSEEKGFGLDPSDVTLEKFPLVLSSPPNLHLKRIN
ncbi:MAG: KUP/HAK/KT family potassium transporter [Flavobacteriia bacterium]|nr:KUP/HAK/KT family potassium transporter [Flavobacteriia bacterium]